VGGDAGAEGSRLCGIVDAIGLPGICNGRGAPCRDIVLFRLGRVVGDWKRDGGGGGSDEPSSPESAVMLGRICSGVPLNSSISEAIWEDASRIGSDYSLLDEIMVVDRLR